MTAVGVALGGRAVAGGGVGVAAGAQAASKPRIVISGNNFLNMVHLSLK
jgi:hypothetical protein